MTQIREVYEFAIEQLSNGVDESEIDINSLLTGGITREWLDQQASSSTRYWSSDPELQEFADSFHNRNMFNCNYGSAIVYSRGSTRASSRASAQRHRVTSDYIGSSTTLPNSSGVPMNMLWYEDANPCDAPTLLADTPKGVVVGWSFDEVSREHADHNNFMNRQEYMPSPDQLDLLKSWATGLGLVEHEVDGQVVAWVAPADWERCPNLSERFFMLAWNPGGYAYTALTRIAGSGLLKWETDSEQEFSEDDIAAANSIRDALANAIGAANGIRRLATERHATAASRVTQYRDNAERLVREHAAMLRSMNEQVQIRDSALKEIAEVDLSIVLNRFDAVDAIASIPQVEGADINPRGLMHVKMKPLHLSGYQDDKVCEYHESEYGADEPIEGCDDCSFEGEHLVDIGRLEVMIDPSESTVRFKSDRRGESYPHPHVSGGGSPCWGAAGVAVNDAFDREDYVTLMHIIMGWAATYNPDDPYRVIEDYPRASGTAGWQS